MRIVHTSDWHVGRRWKGLQRLDEVEAVLDHLAGFIERESIDLVLHSGDVFDSRTPSGESERMVNEFLVRVGRAGARTVVIAGNHDDPQRFDARALLATGANVHILGRPRSASRGGTFKLETRGGETAVVAALPFASPGMWVSALDLAGDEASARTRYAHLFQRAVENLCAAYRDDAVNLLVAHTHLEGAAFGESERRVHLSEDWAATPQTLPPTATYIALGHIHKPQKVAGTLPAWYAGSPLQLDFGEVGQQKTFAVVEAEPRRPARIEHVPYEGGRTLRDIEGTMAELEDHAAADHAGANGDDSWLRVTVKLGEKDPDINRKVRELLPTALVVRVDLPESEVPDSDRPDAGAPAAELYAAYHRRAHEREPAPAVLDTFQHLHERAREDA